MATDLAENTNLRLKTVLEVLAEAVWAGETSNAGTVLAEALQRVPPNEKERELLSGGIPRGHKNLTTATARLVKAGWLSKGRGGWAITENGLRAIVTFREPAAFAAALVDGTVRADVPVPTEAPEGFLPKSSAARGPKTPKKAPAAGAQTLPFEETDDDASKPAARRRKAKAPAATAPAAEAMPQPDTTTSATEPTASAVAVAGDFGKLLGAAEDWAPQYDEVQMVFDTDHGVWKLSADLPAGFYQYKVALNRSWTENYGAFGVRDGANHELHHAGGTLAIRFDEQTKDVVTD